MGSSSGQTASMRSSDGGVRRSADARANIPGKAERVGSPSRCMILHGRRRSRRFRLIE
jgi:hypothetical protein